jgi:L-aspartate oxidase
VIPRALVAADPAYLPTEAVDVLVVGSGVAGLSLALQLATRYSVLLATKGRVGQSTTCYAQGGIAVVLGEPNEQPDGVAEHAHDTLVAAAGLADPAAVEVLVTEAAGALRWLLRAGARFDRDPERSGQPQGPEGSEQRQGGALSGWEAGRLARTREGGHSRSRIVHAGGDATGAEVVRALTGAVRAVGTVRIAESSFLVDLFTDGFTGGRGAVTGALLAAAGGLRAVRARAVVLASGGAGQLYAATTNPAGATGDGIAAALRAGADLADMEFVQFHPTALHVVTKHAHHELAAGIADPRPLVSEALRGEGAVLRDPDGQRFLPEVHPLAELAPRDVVTRAMAARMYACGTDHLLLDATGIGPDRFARRFPTILRACRAAGIDPTRQPIPVAPAAHYLMGGIRTDLDGRTSLAGLYAVGEAACTGAHGANRLASNSLLEGLVFGARAARALTRELPRAGTLGPLDPGPHQRPWPAGPGARGRLRQAMTRNAGVLRSPQGLARAAAVAAGLAGAPAARGTAAFETANLAQLALALTELASRRAESRGAHWRAENPEPDPAWQIRQVLWRQPDGTLGTASVPLAGPGEQATVAATSWRSA